MLNGPVHHIPSAGAAWHHFAGLLLVIALATLQGRAGRVGPFWQIAWALPGTILHELAHLLVAFVTGAQPAGFSILPRRDRSCGEGARRWILGSVSIRRPGVVSALPSALAPLALNVISFYLYWNWSRWFPADLPHTLLQYAAVYLFSYSSIPSGQDVKIALSSPAGVAFYFCLGSGAWWYLW